MPDNNIDKILWGNFYGGLVSMALHPGAKIPLNVARLRDLASIADQMYAEMKHREALWKTGAT